VWSSKRWHISWPTNGGHSRPGDRRPAGETVRWTRFGPLVGHRPLVVIFSLRPGLYRMKVEKTLKFFQSFGRLRFFGLRFVFFVFSEFQSFGRPPILAIPALTVLILTMETVANGPSTHLQRSSSAKRKIPSLGDSANAAAVSICIDMTRLSASEARNMLA